MQPIQNTQIFGATLASIATNVEAWSNWGRAEIRVK
jgi:hypothetical protein